MSLLRAFSILGYNVFHGKDIVTSRRNSIDFNEILLQYQKTGTCDKNQLKEFFDRVT